GDIQDNAWNITPDNEAVVVSGRLENLSIREIYATPIDGGDLVRIHSAFTNDNGNAERDLIVGNYEVYYRADAMVDGETDLFEARIPFKFRPQSITFDQDFDGLTYGDEPIALSATASSQLAVSYSVTGPVMLSEDNSITFTGVGEGSITATQGGDSDFEEAMSVTRNITIAKASLSITADDQMITFGDEIPELTISYDGFVAGEDATVLDPQPTASTMATASSDAGTYDITLTDAVSDNYEITHIDGTLTIEKADQVITFTELQDVDLVNVTEIQLMATSDANLSVSFVLEQGDGMITGNLLTINAGGMFTVTASQAGNDNYNAATEVSQSFTVTDSRKDDQTISFDQIQDKVYGDDGFTLAATATSGLGVSYMATGPVSLDGNTVTITGAGQVEITASQIGDDDFNAAPSVTQSFIVAKASLSITADDQMITFGDAIPELTISYDGFVAGDDASVLDPQPTASTMAMASSDAGSYDITLSDVGTNDNYELSGMNGTLTINKADQTITFPEIMDMDFSENTTITLGATSSAGLDITYTITQGNGSISGDILTLSEHGDFSITASQEGNVNFNAAAAVMQTFTANLVTSTLDEEQAAWSIYPNPTSAQFSISAPLNKDFSVMILDTAGKVIWKNSESGSTPETINVASWERGIYMVQIIDQGEVLTSYKLLLK
ncbi:MAG: MBG domain-containing protein, partial [Bacteroidota bacterium]